MVHIMLIIPKKKKYLRDEVIFIFILVLLTNIFHGFSFF